MKTKIHLIILLSLCSVALHAQNVKVLSFNIQQPYNTNWDGRKGNVANIINSNQPDVIGSQEAHAYMVDYIKSQCPGYASYGRGRECNGSGEGSFIFYKSGKYSVDESNSGSFWFKDNSGACGSGWDPNYNRICTYVRLIENSSGKAFYIFNSHFPTPELSSARSKSAKLLSQKVNDRNIKDPVILTGDFNSTEGDFVTSFFKSGSDNPVKLRDTYRDVHPSGGGSTFGTIKFDYIYVPASSNTQTVASEVIYTPVGSDHFPIWAQLNLGDSNPPSYWSITIKGSNQKYLSSEDGQSAMMCDRESAEGWEEFDVIDHPDGRFSLRGSNGKYVSSENGDSPMMCDRETIGDWEKFTWVSLEGNAFAILGNNGKYVSSENGLSGVMCDRPEINDWETFYWATAASGASAGRQAIQNEIYINNEFTLYPNPAHDYFKVSGLDTNYVQADIYSIEGTLVSTSYVNTEKAIEISQLKEGTYLLKLSSEKGATRSRLLIKK
ncbi:endonuclease/exonuclease/phosphatase family protein [Fulvivirga sediminis]|uniref:T9SS type A sorting domain-containing protein n=1 Tax=Fulvivirga sediminis TaxID=2803949 RepID=A0A937FAY0_9BACT|nr:endonuclease/exonuclease/phosphatase family protein [Fulvivirga sediminis]MBL3657525.1 T9SS type A sorting domain-containing protein [Fulvivirga sediminis]